MEDSKFKKIIDELVLWSPLGLILVPRLFWKEFIEHRQVSRPTSWAFLNGLVCGGWFVSIVSFIVYLIK